MNRFLLAFALTFGAAGIASAQNSSTTTQFDNGNNAIVTQTGQNTSTVDQGVSGVGSGDDNRAVVQQKGTGNVSDIDQTGNNNEGRVYQGAITGYPAGSSTGSSAKLVQTGNNNSDASLVGQGSIIAQGANGGTASGTVTADVLQSGNFGGVTVEQGTEGSVVDSDADVIQSGTGGNMATVYQGVLGGGESTDDEATITQTNASNTAATRQGFSGGISSNSDATISQFGTGGNATTTQAGDDNSATVTQNGTGDVATVDQVGASHMTTLTQTNGSFANIDQQSSGGIVGNTVGLNQSASSATVSQTGNGNRLADQDGNFEPTGAAQQTNGSTLMLTQVSTPDASAFPGNGAFVRQANGAMATIDQTSLTGPGSRAYLIQDGASTATIDQDNQGAGHTANIFQLGAGNIDSITQNGGLMGGGDNARIQTIGNSNESRINQQGTSHVATAIVTGNGNDITVMQTNVTGNVGNTSINTQTGDGNSITVTQNN